MAVNKKGARGPEWGRVTAAMPLGGMGVHKSDNSDPDTNAHERALKRYRPPENEEMRDDTTRLRKD